MRKHHSEGSRDPSRGIPGSTTGSEAGRDELGYQLPRLGFQITNLIDLCIWPEIPHVWPKRSIFFLIWQRNKSNKFAKRIEFAKRFS